APGSCRAAEYEQHPESPASSGYPSSDGAPCSPSPATRRRSRSRRGSSNPGQPEPLALLRSVGPVRNIGHTVRGVLPEGLQDLPGELADLRISGGVPPLLEDIPPRPDIAGDDHLDFGCVRQHRTSGLKRLLAPVSATDQLLGQRVVRVQCVRYGVLEHLARGGRVLRDQRWGDDPLRVMAHVPLADHREAEETVTLQLGQQGPGDTLDVQRQGTVLQHGEVALLDDVVQVPLVGRRLGVGPIPALVAHPARELGQLVHLRDAIPGSINVRDIPGHLTGLQPVESGVGDNLDLHRSPLYLTEARPRRAGPSDFNREVLVQKHRAALVRGVTRGRAEEALPHPAVLGPGLEHHLAVLALPSLAPRSLLVGRTTIPGVTTLTATVRAARGHLRAREEADTTDLLHHGLELVR